MLEICSRQGVVWKRAIVMAIYGGIREADCVVGVVDGLDYVFMRENGQDGGVVVFTYQLVVVASAVAWIILESERVADVSDTSTRGRGAVGILCCTGCFDQEMDNNKPKKTFDFAQHDFESVESFGGLRG